MRSVDASAAAARAIRECRDYRYQWSDGPPGLAAQNIEMNIESDPFAVRVTGRPKRIRSSRVIPVNMHINRRIILANQGTSRRRCGVCLGVCFFRQSTTSMSGNSGTDARFPSKVRQNVVVG